MGYYKRLSENATKVRRFNAARRRAENLANYQSSRLIRMESISEVERFNLAQDPERVVAFNREVEQWQDNVTLQLRATISLKSTTISRELKPRAYTDKYGLINRLGFTFPRYGIYIHKGAGRGQAGSTGSKWTLTKYVNGVPIDTGIIRHTNLQSLNKMNSGFRQAFEWFDPIIRSSLSKLADISAKYWETMAIDATNIYINK